MIASLKLLSEVADHILTILSFCTFNDAFRGLLSFPLPNQITCRSVFSSPSGYLLNECRNSRQLQNICLLVQYVSLNSRVANHSDSEGIKEEFFFRNAKLKAHRKISEWKSNDYVYTASLRLTTEFAYSVDACSYIDR